MRQAKPLRVVVTGGPGGGKTTAADLFRRELGDRVVVVPETATVLFSGGFPRSSEVAPREGAQRAIYHVQRNLEDVQAGLFPQRILLCDRGTVDGAVYWPHGPDAYFQTMATSLEAELARYDAVIFFETAAAGGISIEGGNPVRNESQEDALRLDLALRSLWSQHPQYGFVAHQESFIEKITDGLRKIQKAVPELECG